MKKCEDGTDLTDKEESVFWEIMMKYYKEELEQVFGEKGMAYLLTINPKTEGTSTLNKALPKFYNGHDVDDMFQRYLNGEELDVEEDAIINDIVRRYYSDESRHEGNLKIEDIEIYLSKRMMRPMLKLPVRKEGISRFNESLPRYYDGHDIDSILEKLCNDQRLSYYESMILDNVIWEYYERETERANKDGQKNMIRTLQVNGAALYPSGTLINPFGRNVISSQ